MASAMTLARPYARAAFELARKDDSLADWSGKLGFAAQVANDPQLAGLFGSPRVGQAELESLFLPDGVVGLVKKLKAKMTTTKGAAQ